MVHQVYSFKAVAEAVGVDAGLFRDWHRKLTPRPTRCREDASLEELRAENKWLRRRLRNGRSRGDLRCSRSSDSTVVYSGRLGRTQPMPKSDPSNSQKRDHSKRGRFAKEEAMQMPRHSHSATSVAEWVCLSRTNLLYRGHRDDLKTFRVSPRSHPSREENNG